MTVEGQVSHVDSPGREEGQTLSRRQFLRLLLCSVAGAGAMAATSCQQPASQAAARAPLPTPVPLAEQYPAVPVAPASAPDPGVLRFFTAHEAETVEAITARILPGTPDDPGAREAGVANYIDYTLSQDDGFNQPVYREGPFAQVYEGDEPPQDARETEIWVAADEIERYGYQSPLTPAEVFRAGLESLDTFAQERFGDDFVALDEEQQDAIVEAMANDEASGFEPFSGQQFFQVLRRQTMKGMFSDPAYGGNRDKTGWRLVGYPGAQRSYSPREFQTEGLQREPWGLDELPHFHYSRPRDPTVSSPARRIGERLEANESGRNGSSH